MTCNIPSTLKTVPYFFFGLLLIHCGPDDPLVEEEYILENDINKLVEMSIGKSLINPQGWREGIVIRSHKEQFINGERFSFKTLNPKFLLKYDG